MNGNTHKHGMSALRRIVLTATAAALTAGGLVLAPAVAQAAPVCDHYEFDGLSIYHDNTVITRVDAKGDRVGPSAGYISPGTAETRGQAVGGLAGTSVDFTITWQSGPGRGMWSRYTGQVGNDLYVSGTTENSQGAHNPWRTYNQVRCIPPAPKPPVVPPPVVPPPVVPPPPVTKPARATVVKDVDLYDKPGGKVIGMLRKTTVVDVAAPCKADDWCRTTSPAGWAWGSFLKN